AGAGLCALWGVGLIGLPLAEWMRPASQIVLGVIFTVRGVVSYLPIKALANVTEPFATNNRRIYSPLILAIGVGFWAMLFFAQA
ncbi:MAG: DUF3995 domain-containing protein, partial [Alphaproteobacteria bacterium]|nr:DUF3995 domain-containing protein [Alphaproteobacteria bacterium]